MPSRSATPTPRVGSTADVDPIFVSVANAAATLGLSRSEMYRLCDAQVIESRVFGKRRLVAVADLRRFAASLPAQRAG